MVLRCGSQHVMLGWLSQRRDPTEETSKNRCGSESQVGTVGTYDDCAPMPRFEPISSRADLGKVKTH